MNIFIRDIATVRCLVPKGNTLNVFTMSLAGDLDVSTFGIRLHLSIASRWALAAVQSIGCDAIFAAVTAAVAARCDHGACARVNPLIGDITTIGCLIPESNALYVLAIHLAGNANVGIFGIALDLGVAGGWAFAAVEPLSCDTV